MHLSMEQETAIDLCCDKDYKLVAVTGGAGTGKTTILKDVYEQLDKQPVLCAPTGRAARRILEATGYHAITIHRLLEFPMPDDIKSDEQFTLPRRNSNRPISYRCVIIDEAPMVNDELFDFIIDALPRGGRILMFGDINQLPPVKGQSKFAWVLDNRPHIYLTYNFRSDDNLIESANRILKNQIPARGDKFEIIYTSDTIGALRDIVQPEYKTLQHQVLTPSRKGSFGSTRLSSMIRTKFSLRADCARLSLPRYHDEKQSLTVLENDKVLWTKNDYQLNIFNGETGLIEIEDEENGDLLLHLEDREVKVPPLVRGAFDNYYDPRKNIDLAYAMTTHKAQGSEYDTVIYVINKGQNILLNRANFYTAVTRARHKVIVICDRHAMSLSVRRPI